MPSSPEGPPALLPGSSAKHLRTKMLPWSLLFPIATLLAALAVNSQWPTVALVGLLVTGAFSAVLLYWSGFRYLKKMKQEKQAGYTTLPTEQIPDCPVWQLNPDSGEVLRRPGPFNFGS